MANNWQINAIAGLDGTQSRNQLNSDIKGLARNLDKLKLYAEIDKNQVTQLQHQLKNLQVQLNNVTVSDAVINGLVAKINAGLQNVNIGNINVGNIGNQAQQVGQQIGATIAQGVNSAIQKSGGFKSEYLFDGKNPQNKVTETVLKDFQKLSDGIVTVKEQMKSVGGKSFLDGFTVSIEHATGQVETLAYKLKDIEGKTGQSFQYSGGSINDNGVIKQMNAISAKADSLQTKLDKLKANYSDINASRPIKDSGNISALSQQYDKVTQAIENVRSADNATFSSMVSNAQREITTLESMVSQFRNAENVATQMKSVDISSGIAQAQERLAKLKANSSGFEQMTNTIRNLDIAIEGVGDKSSLDKFINDLRTAETQLSRVKAESKQLEQLNKIQLSMSTGGYESKVDSLIGKTQQWVDANGNARISTNALQTAMQNLNTAYANITATGGNTVANQQALIEAERALDTEVKKVQSSVTSMNVTMAKSTAVDGLRQKVQRFYDINTKSHRTYGGQLKAIMSELSYGAEVPITRLRQIQQEFIGIQNSARQTGKLGRSFFDGIKEQASKFIGWFSVTSVVMEGVQAIKKMTQEVIAVDSAMVELRKVSDASNNDLKNYFDEAAKSAKDLGATVSDVINATADWSRLGYSLPDSKKLAEIATLYKNVGDGIDIDTANQSLVSTLQGFKLDTEDAMHIIDSFNEVANNYAIDSAGIGEALQRSASSMYAAGNTLEETIGLVTAANAVVQDPDSIGTAYKTISMRIRGAKTEMEQLGLETDGMAESTATLQKEILALTGVDIMKDKNTFKSTYAILDELATKWSDLTDIQQASVTELIAGKRQGNIVSALMTNFETAREATQTAVESQGSALREQENYEKGIQFSLDRISASWQEFSNHFLDSSFIKGIVDFGNTTINVIDDVNSALGTLGTIATIGGGILGAKNLG